MKKSQSAKDTAQLLFSYFIFGSIGLFVKGIPLPSSVIASFRGICGAAFIFIFMLMKRSLPNRKELGENLLWLILSGGAIGFNWILLFESYRYTSIATATLCYYMAPVFMLLGSALFLKEKIEIKSVLAIAVSVVGMLLISGSELLKEKSILGIILGLAAAILYAAVIIINKKMGEISSETRAFAQILTAGITVLPYAFLTAKPIGTPLDGRAIILLATVGLIHTGVAYVMNLGAVAKLSASSVAALSYTDPIVAIVLESIVYLRLPGVAIIVGGLLILGGTALAVNKKEG